jgi:molecular chaperone HtpG
MSNQLQKVLNQSMQSFEAPARIMEVNPHAALVERLCELSANSDNDEFIRDCGRQLFADALIIDGIIQDAEDVTTRSLRFMEELSRSRTSIVT